MPITEHQLEVAKAQKAEFRKLGFRVEVDERAASLGAKIKDARHDRIPYLLVLGAEEADKGAFAVRSRREGELGEMSFAAFAKKLQADLDNKVC